MLSPDLSTFEHLLANQSQRLLNSDPNQFSTSWQKCANEVLDFFDIDRLILYPNSMLSLNAGKTMSVERDNIPKVVKEEFAYGKPSDYFKLLNTTKNAVIFSEYEMRNHKSHVLNTLQKQGAKWHCIIPLKLFGKTWGALSFSTFTHSDTPIDDNQLARLKVICEVWLCYWQHAILMRNLQISSDPSINESEKLLRLTKKQCSVLSLLAAGFTAKQCAEKLHLSPRTIESHKYRMIDLLELDNNTELLQFALRNGLGMKD